ncbi:hypothetical protein [Microcoleus sp. S13_B4]|uniref:hypothetical protein n=1 Tax=Microcoleus sp. S13_B4 TaxID=3055408 RepID=UPI002FD1FFAD
MYKINTAVFSCPIATQWVLVIGEWKAVPHTWQGAILEKKMCRACTSNLTHEAMTVEEAINFLENFVYQQTGEHLTRLEQSIIRGVVGGLTYKEIQQNEQKYDSTRT